MHQLNPLQFMLNPIALDEFLEKHYSKRALHISGTPEKFRHLFTWNSLNEVLNSSSQPHPTVKMSHGGKQFKPKDAIDLVRAVQKGATLIVENIDRYNLALGDFLNRLSEEINEQTRFNLYLSYPENQGYKIHYDTHDFLILQIAGYKEWWIFPETMPSVLFKQKTHGVTPPPKESLYLNCKLGPGDVLYVPRGHWHYAMAREKPSMHLTLAMFVKTGIDFMRWLADELTDHEEFRSAFPLRLTNQHTSDENQSADNLRKLKVNLVKVLDDTGLYKKFLQYSTAVSRNRHPFNFPHHTVSSIEDCRDAVSFRRRHQVASISLNKDSKKIKLTCGGRLLSFDEKAEPILRFIFNSSQFTKQELIAASNGISWDTASAILLPLLREGFITCE